MLQTQLVSAAAIVLVVFSIIAVAVSGYRTPRSNINQQNETTLEFALIDKPGLPNLYQPSESIYSGGQPDGEVGFQQLAELGIKTIISVDGARPDVGMAQQYGLTYVHLPHGYDGIDPEHAIKLAKAVQSSDGPVYIHCHHGKHRSPAATAVVCIGLGLLEKQPGIRFLETAGTSPHYVGLYRSVSASNPISAEVLNQINHDFPSVAPGTPLVQSMVAIEEHFAAIAKMIEQDGVPPVDSPDLSVTHEALLLSEKFAELVRQSQAADTEPDRKEYLDAMKRSHEQSEQLYHLLSAKADFSTVRASKVIEQLRNNCRSCHQTFRD